MRQTGHKPSHLVLEKNMKILMIVRNCCTSGNCSTCTSFNKQKVKVVQFLTKSEEMAQKVAKNWAEYKAEVKEATEDEIVQLETRSGDWVREKLLKPEHINDRVFTNTGTR